MKTVAVLFARADSIYKTIPGCDVYDIERDARKWPGGSPVVAHPPCRAWGRLRQFAKPREDEKQLAVLAVSLVQQFGGVLEHPASSSLFNDLRLPKPGELHDKHGGQTFEIRQVDFGHRAEKRTWIYAVGILPKFVFSMPPMRVATHCIRPSKSYPRLPSVTKPEREHTPPELAVWLVDIARATTAPNPATREGVK